MQIDVYYDTVCPWCFLDKRRLELAVASRPQYDSKVRGLEPVRVAQLAAGAETST